MGYSPQSCTESDTTEETQHVLLCIYILLLLFRITRLEREKNNKMLTCYETPEMGGGYGSETKIDVTEEFFNLVYNSVQPQYFSTVQSLSRVQLFATPWTAALQAPLSMGFSRQEYWSGMPLLSPGDLPYPRIKPASQCLLHQLAGSLSLEPPKKPLSRTQPNHNRNVLVL